MPLNIVRNLISKFTDIDRSSIGTDPFTDTHCSSTDPFMDTHHSSIGADPFALVPQELLDQIISYLADDSATLISCAQVHTTWTNISRYHLAPLSLVISSPSRANELVELLRSSCESLSLSITGITLVGEIPLDDTITSGESPHTQPYSQLLHLLKVKRVVFRSAGVENDTSLVGLFAQDFPNLVSLKVVCASYQDITSFMRALSGSFPRLAELSIELGSGDLDLPNVLASGSLAGLSDLRLSMPCLSTLHVGGQNTCWNNELVRWVGGSVVGMLGRLDRESIRVRSTCRVVIQENTETLGDGRLAFVKCDVVFDLSDLKCL